VRFDFPLERSALFLVHVHDGGAVFGLTSGLFGFRRAGSVRCFTVGRGACFKQKERPRAKFPPGFLIQNGRIPMRSGMMDRAGAFRPSKKGKTCMAKPNYAFAKRQRELAKKQKKEAKKQQRAAAREPQEPVPPPAEDTAK
jgi:hypothetical protein